ncbi:MAG TPA: hypothetical protein VIX80_04595 [Candidatus Kapabacteria bacterium]
MQHRYAVLIALLFGGILIGCLGDPINEPTIVPRLVLQPQVASLEAITGTNDIKAKWTPSPTDTQGNFKGYYIELYRSAKYSDSAYIGEDSLLEPILAKAHVPRSDTSYIFPNQTTSGNRYSVRVYGEQFTDPTFPDSITLSKDYANASLDYDSDPVIAPTVFMGGSIGPNLVRLQWSQSPSASNPGFSGYIIRYRDNTNTKSLIQTVRTGKLETFLTVNVPATSSQNLIIPYSFSIKALRNDSTESADSTLLVWSGAWSVPQVGVRDVKIDTLIFIGQTNQYYDLIVTDRPEAQIRPDTSSGDITLTALSGAKFASRIDSGTSLDSVCYDEPFDDALFSQTSIVLPHYSNAGGKIVYILFAEGTRARLIFIADPGNNNSLLQKLTKGLRVSGTFQPLGTYNLKYF